MSADQIPPSDVDLEMALTNLGRHLAYPPTPDLTGAVHAHIDQYPRRPSRRRLRPAVFYPLIAAAVLIASVLALTPGGRAAVASWFRVIGVRIEFGGSPPGPLGHALDLGTQTSLAGAQSRVSFSILVPRDPGPPDEVYVGTPPLAGGISLLYRARGGLPRSSATGAGLLVTEYQHAFLDVKLAPAPSSIVPLKILGDQAVWIAGLPHVVYDLDAHGHLVRDTIRLAGHVLVWYHHGITIRMEGQLPLDQAIRVARSVRPLPGR
jgi:hypothetical protein